MGKMVKVTSRVRTKRDNGETMTWFPGNVVEPNSSCGRSILAAGLGQLVDFTTAEDLAADRKKRQPAFKPEETKSESGSVAGSTGSKVSEMADANGIDLATVTGTGKNGRILIGDVQKAIEARG